MMDPHANNLSISQGGSVGEKESSGRGGCQDEGPSSPVRVVTVSTSHHSTSRMWHQPVLRTEYIVGQGQLGYHSISGHPVRVFGQGGGASFAGEGARVRDAGPTPLHLSANPLRPNFPHHPNFAQVMVQAQGKSSIPAQVGINVPRSGTSTVVGVLKWQGPPKTKIFSDEEIIISSDDDDERSEAEETEDEDADSSSDENNSSPQLNDEDKVLADSCNNLIRFLSKGSGSDIDAEIGTIVVAQPDDCTYVDVTAGLPEPLRIRGLVKHEINDLKQASELMPVKVSSSNILMHSNTESTGINMTVKEVEDHKSSFLPSSGNDYVDNSDNHLKPVQNVDNASKESSGKPARLFERKGQVYLHRARKQRIISHSLSKFRPNSGASKKFTLNQDQYIQEKKKCNLCRRKFKSRYARMLHKVQVHPMIYDHDPVALDTGRQNSNNFSSREDWDCVNEKRSASIGTNIMWSVDVETSVSDYSTVEDNPLLTPIRTPRTAAAKTEIQHGRFSSECVSESENSKSSSANLKQTPSTEEGGITAMGLNKKLCYEDRHVLECGAPDPGVMLDMKEGDSLSPSGRNDLKIECCDPNVTGHFIVKFPTAGHDQATIANENTGGIRRSDTEPSSSRNIRPRKHKKVQGAEKMHAGDIIIYKKKKNGREYFTCDICSQILTQRSNVPRHVQKHIGELKYKCDKCTKGFSRSDALKRHVKSHNPGKDIKCTVCEVRFTTISHRRRHYLQFHCGKSAENETTTNDKALFKCDECPKQYKFEARLRKHKSTIHGRVEQDQSDPKPPPKTRQNQLKKGNNSRNAASLTKVRASLKTDDINASSRPVKCTVVEMTKTAAGSSLFKCSNCELTFTEIKAAEQHLSLRSNFCNM